MLVNLHSCAYIRHKGPYFKHSFIQPIRWRPSLPGQIRPILLPASGPTLQIYLLISTDTLPAQVYTGCLANTSLGLKILDCEACFCQLRSQSAARVCMERWADRAVCFSVFTNENDKCICDPSLTAKFDFKTDIWMFTGAHIFKMLLEWNIRDKEVIC